MSNNLTVNTITFSHNAPLFTLRLNKDGNCIESDDDYILTVNEDHTVEVEGELKPVEHARQLAQVMQMATNLQDGVDKYDGFELYRIKLIQRAKEMEVNQEFIDLLESDLFYYYLSGKEFDEE